MMVVWVGTMRGAGGKGDDFKNWNRAAGFFEGLREARGGSIKSYFPGLPAAGLDAGLLGAMGGAVVGGALGVRRRNGRF